ncbi:MAG: hypothetical protein ABIN48_14325 [Ginsengibacter sp.]
MHNYFGFLLIAVILSCNSTNKFAVSTEVPICLQEKIKLMSEDISEGMPVSLTEFTYHGKKVYYLVAPCCDKYNIVFDSTCTILGYPDGGFTGRGDGKMTDFEKAAINPKVIWEAKRDSLF